MRRSTLQDYTERCTLAASMLVRSLERAAQLVRNFKDVAVDQTSDRRRRFNLAQGIAEVVQTFEAGARGALPQVVVDVPTEFELDSYPGTLSQVPVSHSPTSAPATAIGRPLMATNGSAHDW